jgi:hypothetical protein
MATVKQVLVGGAVVLTAVVGLAAYAMFAPEPKGHPLARGTKIRTRKGNKLLTVASHDGGSCVYVHEEPGRCFNPWQFSVVKGGHLSGPRARSEWSIYRIVEANSKRMSDWNALSRRQREGLLNTVALPADYVRFSAAAIDRADPRAWNTIQREIWAWAE